MRRPVLAAISVADGRGGIAQVSRLLGRVMSAEWPQSRVVTLHDDTADRATVSQKARFAGRIAGAQVAGQADWTLFTHLQLLRVQRLVPDSLRRPYAVFLHGIEAWNGLSAGEVKLLAGAKLRLANSRYTANRVAAAHPGMGPIVACPLALPAANDDGDSCGSPGLQPGGARLDRIGPSAVLIVARMNAAERYKGHDQLIDAWPNVMHAVPHAQLVVVGEGDDTGRLRVKAAQSGLADSVLFLGRVTDSALRRLYERAAVFAMPSRGEGFGLVYLEAMSHRLPCIGSRQDAATEIIEDGETGVLVDQADVAGLAAAIVRLLSDGELRARMGAAGAQRVREVFSFERFSRQVVTELRRAFDRKP